MLVIYTWAYGRSYMFITPPSALQCLQDHGLYESQAEALLREEVLGRLHSLMLQWVSRVAEIRGALPASLLA